MDLHHIPLDRIDDHAFLRDRLELDPDALAALQAAILAEGLRHPVELAAIDGPLPFALIAGLRRMTALRALHAAFPGPRWQSVAAVIRTPATTAAALAEMVSENENRAQITPWEKAAFLTRAVEARLFDTLDAAVAALFPTLTRQARSRLRGWAGAVQALDGLIATPRHLTARRMDRLAAACRGGMVELIEDILADHPGAGLETQWHALAPALVEAMLTEEDPGPAPALLRPPGPRSQGPGRRRLTLPNGVRLRREWTPTGWIIRLNGAQARHAGLVDDILDKVERWFGEG